MSQKRHTHTTVETLTFKILNVKTYFRVPGYNTCNDAIRLQILPSINATNRICVLALTVSDIVAFKMFDLEYVGQDHPVPVQHL